MRRQRRRHFVASHVSDMLDSASRTYDSAPLSKQLVEILNVNRLISDGLQRRSSTSGKTQRWSERRMDWHRRRCNEVRLRALEKRRRQLERATGGVDSSDSSFEDDDDTDSSCSLNTVLARQFSDSDSGSDPDDYGRLVRYYGDLPLPADRPTGYRVRRTDGSHLWLGFGQLPELRQWVDVMRAAPKDKTFGRVTPMLIEQDDEDPMLLMPEAFAEVGAALERATEAHRMALMGIRDRVVAEERESLLEELRTAVFPVEMDEMPGGKMAAAAAGRPCVVVGDGGEASAANEQPGSWTTTRTMCKGSLTRRRFYLTYRLFQ